VTRLNIAKVAVLVFVSRIVTFVIFPNPIFYPDSPGYSNGKFFNFDLVSLTGDSSRTWPTPLLYSILPNINFISAAQLAISGFAWFWLVYNAVLHVNTRRFQILLLVILISFSSSTFIVQWDTTVLGTSLLISTTVLVLAQLIRVLKQPHKLIDTAFALFLLVLLATEKLSNFPLVAGLMMIVAVATFKKLKKIIFAIVSVMAIFGLAYSVTVGANVDRSWPGSYSGTTLLWQLGNQSPVAESFKEFLSSNSQVPLCIYAEAPYKDLNSSIGKILNNCDDGLKYTRAGLQEDFIKFSLSNPIEIAKLSSLGLGAYYTNSSNNYGNAVQILPNIFNSITFGATQPSLNSGSIENQSEGYLVFNSGKAFWLYVPGLGVLLAGLLAAAANTRKSKIFLIDVSFLAIAVLFLLQAILTTTFLPSEWVRQLAPYLIPLTALNIVSLIVYVERKLGSKEIRISKF
jgi:hypothetical protein